MKIRTKLIIIYFALIIPFIAIFGAITIYEINSVIKTHNRLDIIIKYIHFSYDLQIALDRAIMPGNDYIITGDKRYIDDFHRVSKDVERILKEYKEYEEMHQKEIHPTINKKEETEILKEIRFSWQNVKDISLKIFAIPNPIGNKTASKLMEEMDYKWRYPFNKKFDRFIEIHMKEYSDALNQHHKALRFTFVILAVSSAILIIGGLTITLLYSLRLSKFLESIHKDTERIAKGDFKTRLDVKTGDEFEQLSNTINEMSVQLESLYSNLETKIEERTKEIKESEEKFRVLSSGSHDAIIMIEEKGVISYWNPAAEKIFGYTEDEAIGEILHELIVPERFRANASKGLETFREKGEGPIIGKALEQIGLRKDGTEFYAEHSISAVKIKEKWYAIGIVRDITERKKVEEELKQKIEELERFRKATIQREFRMKELIDENERLKKKVEDFQK